MICEDKVNALVTDLMHRVSPTNISSKYLKHYYCDFIELYAFFYKEAVTKSEILDLFDAYSFSFGFDNHFDGSGIEDPASVMEDQNIGRVSQENDQKESDIAYLFQCLEDRMNNGLSKYAFTIDSNSVVLKENLSLEQKIYLVFLFCSNLSVFKEFQSDITSEFEKITYEVLKAMFSTSMEIKQFGKNSDYSGTAKQKIRLLASDMNILTNDSSINAISSRNTQDRGIDIILWQPYKDEAANNMLIYLVQCACGKEWASKSHEVNRYLSYFQFNGIQPTNILAISYGLSMFGSFEQADDVAGTKALVLDRFRLLEFINESSFCNADNLVSIDLIDYLIGIEVALN